MILQNIKICVPCSAEREREADSEERERSGKEGHMEDGVGLTHWIGSSQRFLFGEGTWASF